MEKIKFSCYKYAPETARATVNGQPVEIAGIMIPQWIATGQHDKAIAAIKKIYRCQNKKEARHTYIFYEEGSRKFYYIGALSFKASDDLKSRLYCYKELKHHLQKNPPTYATEAGYITPNGATTPNVTTQQIKIDFSHAAKVKIA